MRSVNEEQFVTYVVAAVVLFFFFFFSLRSRYRTCRYRTCRFLPNTSDMYLDVHPKRGFNFDVPAR